jgi:hypothetical protein
MSPSEQSQTLSIKFRRQQQHQRRRPTANYRPYKTLRNRSGRSYINTFFSSKQETRAINTLNFIIASPKGWAAVKSWRTRVCMRKFYSHSSQRKDVLKYKWMTAVAVAFYVSKRFGIGAARFIYLKSAFNYAERSWTTQEELPTAERAVDQ